MVQRGLAPLMVSLALVPFLFGAFSHGIEIETEPHGRAALKAKVAMEAEMINDSGSRRAAINRIFDKKGNHYAVLGVGTSATQSEITAAFRRLAVLVHPDKFHDDNSLRETALVAFRAVQDAHSTIGDPKLRDEYDAKQLPSDVGASGTSGGGFTSFLIWLIFFSCCGGGTRIVYVEREKAKRGNFLQFSNEKRAAVKAANPGITFGDLAKKLGVMWHELDPLAKEKYK
ncbi:DnaJ domain-containing protein [Pavlovales sp. CCMP2436]|nr:DnaJ domain-containing protein [Pavlovales sp. CCMP2436]